MQRATDIKQSKLFKAIFAGFPNSGKSTAALLLWSLINKDPEKVCHVYQYDICDPLMNIPGVDYNRVMIESYPPAEVDMTQDAYDLPRNVGDKILRDMVNLKNILLGKVKTDQPLPDTIILEGWVNALRHLHNRQMRIDKKQSEEDYSSTYTPFRNRLKNVTMFWDKVIPLPVNVIITTWPGEETKQVKNANGKTESIKTGAFTPELGGQFDIYGPGKVDATLLFYSTGGKHFVRTRSNMIFKGFGWKDRYDLREEYDVTLTNKDGVFINPWKAIWNTGD